MDIVVLCYHAVSEEWPPNLAIRPHDLKLQLEWMLSAGYTPATFADAVLETPSDKTFAVTFDDGWNSVKRLGWPIMRELGVPGTVFVSTAATDDAATKPHSGDGLKPYFGTEYEHELFPLGWDELGALDSDGWEIASHCVYHPLLTQISDERLERELTESKRRLTEVFGKECRTFAYPTGDHDARVVEATRAAGYKAAGTLPSVFPRHPDLLAYPRISVGRNDSLFTFRLKVSRATRFLRSTRVASAGVSAFRSARQLVTSV